MRIYALLNRFCVISVITAMAASLSAQSNSKSHPWMNRSLSPEERAAMVMKHGADEVIDHSREDLRERVKALTAGKGLDVCVDNVGGQGFATLARSMRWNGRLLAQGLGDVSQHQVWRVMRKHNLHLERRQSWCVSTDPEFSRKAADVVGLYLNPPENALVLCVDEKPHIQALERAQGWIRLPNGRALTGFNHEYKRNGTTTLFAALNVATGLVHAGHYRRRRRREFLDFMNELVSAYVGKELHVVLDNLNTHKPKEDCSLAGYFRKRKTR